MGKWIFFISFLFQIYASYLFPSTKFLASYFLPLFFLVALVLGYPYFKEKKQYFILSFLFGLWFDLGSYGTFFIEGVLLVCIAFCLHKIWKYCRFHLGNVFLLLLLAILLYEGMHFFLILLFADDSVTLFSFCSKVLHSLILNFLYAFLLYLFVYKKGTRTI